MCLVLMVFAIPKATHVGPPALELLAQRKASTAKPLLDRSNRIGIVLLRMTDGRFADMKNW
jgi:hypothetical protein